MGEVEHGEEAVVPIEQMVEEEQIEAEFLDKELHLIQKEIQQKKSSICIRNSLASLSS